VHPVDTVAWTETLGVGRKELPWALKAKVRQICDLHDDANRLRVALASAPDEELALMLTAACRSLAAAGNRLAETLTDVSRTA
jgi:hypothetical protein